jgi:hypothetical protein
MDRYLDVGDVVEYLDVAPSTVRYAISAQKVRVETLAGNHELCVLDQHRRLIVRGSFRNEQFKNTERVVNVDPGFVPSEDNTQAPWPVEEDPELQVHQLEQEVEELRQTLAAEQEAKRQLEQLSESRIETLKAQLTKERRFVAVRHKRTLKLMADSANVIPELSPSEEAEYSEWTQELPGVDF